MQDNLIGLIKTLADLFPERNISSNFCCSSLVILFVLKEIILLDRLDNIFVYMKSTFCQMKKKSELLIKCFSVQQ